MKPTSRSRKPRAVKEEATRLHSKIVRARDPWCRCGCGRPTTDAAHIVGRVYSHTRTDELNAVGLAAECHRRLTNWQDEWIDFLSREIGMDEYRRLKSKAQAGVSVKFDWFEELDRLKALAAEIEEAA